MVFRTLTRLTGSAECVDDLAQEVFLRLYRALPGFRGEAQLSTYLYRIVINVAQEEWKRRRREDRRADLLPELVPLGHDIRAIMHGIWDANRKLDEILSYLRDEDDGDEEEETDLDS